MANLNYLSGSESATAARMNLLWAKFDAKLTALLGGRTFILAFPDAFVTGYNNGAVPRQLIGKPFFFTSGNSVYSQRIFEAINLNTDGSYAARPYDHTQFTAVHDAIVAGGILAHDDSRHIATIATVASGSYAGLPVSPYVGFFEHSLEAHRIDLNALGVAGTSAGVRYFLRETAISAPEKLLKWAVAEIIIEGPTDITLPTTGTHPYDKYSFFRIHNLNHVQATVHFGGDYDQVVEPLACTTVRRDKPTGTGKNYRQGYNYFFKFETPDPRCYWFFPTERIPDVNDYNSQGFSQQNAANAQGANNITNPAVLFDWVKAFKGPYYVEPNSWLMPMYAWFNVDESVQWDAYPLNSAAFGDPSNGATLLGDLIFHKGKIILARVSKDTTKNVNNQPLVEFVEFSFTGFANIIADFTTGPMAGKGLAVTTDANSQYVIKPAVANDQNWTYELIPIGTNLFKRGEDGPTVIRLTNAGVTIDTINFPIPEIQVEPVSMSQQWPTLVYPRELRSFSTSRTQLPFPGTVVAHPVNQIYQRLIPNSAKAPVIHGVQNVTVAQLLDLHFFGDNRTPGSQELSLDGVNSYVQFTNRLLRLTPQGLVLTYTERVPANILPALVHTWYHDDNHDLVRWKLSGDPSTGWWEINRVIKFRGHGWGWCEEGKEKTMFWVPRRGRPGVSAIYQDEILGQDGADWSSHTIFGTENRVKTLKRAQTERLWNGPLNGRFYTYPPQQMGVVGNLHGPLDGLLAFSVHQNDFLWYQLNRTQLATGGTGPSIVDSGLWTTYDLLPEHYNAMARLINSITTGQPLSFYCLRWTVAVGGAANRPVGLRFDPYGVNSFFTLPVPMDCITVNPNGDDLALLNQLGIPILTPDDFPAEYQTLKVAFPKSAVYTVDVTTTFSNMSRTVNPGGPSNNFDYFADILQDWGNVTFNRLEAKWNYGRFGGIRDFTAGDYSIGQLGFNPNNEIHRNLVTDYAGFTWASISSIQALIEGLHFNFVWGEVVEPWKLEKLTMPQSAADGISATHSVTHTNVLVVTTDRPDWASYGAGPLPPGHIETNTPLWLTGHFKIDTFEIYKEGAELIVFHRAEVLAEALWKLSPNDAGPPIIWNAKSWSAHYSNWLTNGTKLLGTGSADIILQGIPGVDISGNPITLTSFYLVPTNDIGGTNTIIHIEFPPSNSGETEQAVKIFKLANAFQNRACHINATTGTSSTMQFNFFPWYLWSAPLDWWVASVGVFTRLNGWPVVSMVEGDRGEFIPIFDAGTGLPKAVTATPASGGLTMIESVVESGLAYRVVYDPTQNVIDLTGL